MSGSPESNVNYQETKGQTIEALASLIHEEVIPLETAGNYIPGRPSRPTCFRYAFKGVLGEDGQRHKLPSILSCNKRWTSKEAITRFLMAINAPAIPVAAAVSQTRRQAQKAAAKQELAALGVK